MALQCNTLHRFLILTMIYCSSSFGMNLHCLYMRDDNGPLPYVAKLPFSQINFLKNLIEKKLKEAPQTLHKIQDIHDEAPETLAHSLSHKPPKPHSTKKKQKRVQSVKLVVGIKKTISKIEKKKKRPSSKEKSKFSFCPCGNTKTKTRGGLYNHVKNHHYDENTQLFYCNASCEKEFEEIEQVIHHFVHDHKFFYVGHNRALVRYRDKQQ